MLTCKGRSRRKGKAVLSDTAGSIPQTSWSVTLELGPTFIECLEGKKET